MGILSAKIRKSFLFFIVFFRFFAGRLDNSSLPRLFGTKRQLCVNFQKTSISSQKLSLFLWRNCVLKGGVDAVDTSLNKVFHYLWDLNPEDTPAR